MDIFTADGYAHWANYLINGDRQGLSDDDFRDLQLWLALQEVTENQCLDVDETYEFGCPDGTTLLPGMLATYTFCDDTE